MRFKAQSGSFIASILIGRQISPNRTRAANGLRNSAMTTLVIVKEYSKWQ